MNLNDNFVGIIVNGQLVILGFSASQGSTLTANRNFIGILVNSANFTVGNVFPITASDNAMAGIRLEGTGALGTNPPASDAKFVLERNGIGISIVEGMYARFVGGLTATGNDVGHQVDGATAVFYDNPANPSTIT